MDKLPKDWLNSNYGTQLPVGGLDYTQGTLVPFIIAIIFVLVFIASLFMLIIGGITWIMSRGEKEALAKAKATVTYALIGLILGLGSFLILNTLGYFLGLNF